LIASPLVRESGKTGDSLADRIEQQSKQNQAVEEPVPAVERTAVPQEGSAGDQTGTAGKPMNESDVPSVPVTTEPASPYASDLPK
jgi:hypothetical protein